MPSSLIHKRWFLVSAIIALLLLATLVVTPYLIRHLTKNWLLDNGGEQVQFRDVDFNPFTATLRLKVLEVRVDDEITLAFDSAGLKLNWRPLLNKQIDVQSVELKGLHLVIDNRDALKLGGIMLPASTDTGSPAPDDRQEPSEWLSGIENLTLTDIRIRYLDRDIESKIVLDQLQLTGLRQWTPGRSAHLEVTGSVNGAKVILSTDLAPLAQHPLYRGSLSLSEFPLASLAPLARPTLDGLQGRLTLQSDFNVELSSDTVQISHEGKLALADLQLATAEANLDIDSVQLDGLTEVRHDSPDKSMMLATEGQLNVGPVSATAQEPDIQIENRRLTWQGKLDFKQGTEQPAIQLTSNIDLEGLAVATGQRKTALLDLDMLHVGDLHIEGLENIRAATVEAQGFMAGRNADLAADQQAATALLGITHTTISQPSFHNHVFAIDSVQHDGLHLKVHRDSEGELTLMQLIDRIAKLAAGPATETEPAQQTGGTVQTASTADTVAIVIKRLQIDGDSVISIMDESVDPVFKTELLLQQVRIEDLDSRQPAQSSALLIDSRIGKHTSLSLKGTIQPFQEPPGMDLQGNISALDLPPLSSYTRSSLGILLNSGTLDSELSLKTKAESLEGLATLQLQQLELTGTDSKDSLQSRLPVPMNVALDTLRDKQNRIQLKIPVAGNINDPKFSLNDAINQAVAGSLQKGAFSYLKYALQPYGTLISVAQYAGETMSKVRLNPIEFPPGQFTLSAGDREYLGKVAQVLKDRPKIAIKLCGVAVQQDEVALQQQLPAQQPVPAPTGTAQPSQPPPAVVIDKARFTELAQQRADTIKDYLIEQHGIPASHLVGCLPQLELDQPTATPRTDLLL